MKNIVFLTFIAFSFLMSSCARKPGKKLDMSFVLGASFDSAGGAMLYGKNLSNGEEFGDSVTIEAPFEKYLSFGQWKFWVVAWPGDPAAGTQMTGLARCDFKMADLQPAGNAPEVVFNLSNANCDSNEFSPARNNFTGASSTKTYNMFPLVDFRTCQNLADTNSYSENCLKIDGELGPFLSYKIILEKHENGAPFGPAYESPCFKSVFTGAQQDISEFAQTNIPLGSPDFPVRTVVRAYYGSIDCDQTNDGFEGSMGPALGFKEIIFPRGLHQPAPGTKVFVDNTISYCPVDYGISPTDATCSTSVQACEGDLIDGVLSSSCAGLAAGATGVTFDAGVYKAYTTFRIATEATVNDICQGFRISETFAAGNGLDKPYMICTPTQFNNISDTYLSSDFYLMADLNMNLADEVQINQNCGFWPISNTIPIGGFASDPGTCLTFYTGASTPIFTGTFHGRDHWIMNARIENEELVAFGLFRKTNSNSVIKNINFSDLEVRGKSNMGGVVGNLNSSSLENIYVYSLDVKGGENGADCKTGGLVGSAGGPSIINNVHIEDGNVSCKASGLGGILGVGGAHIDTASFSGQIESDTYNPTPINGVGGIAGRLATNGSITKAKSEGLIDSSAVQLGGILGSGDNSISLKHIYSTMVISSHNWISDNTTPLNIGGLVGFNDLVNFKYGYFAGFIYDSCNHPTQSNCKIGTIYGGLGGSGATPVNASAVAGTLNKGGFDDGTPLNYDTGLRSTTGFSSELTAYNSDVANGCNIIPCWSQIEGDIPRLNFEDHDCEDPTYQANINTQQVTYGRGNTESNPIIICNASQLKEIGNLVQRFSKHYMVKDNILMGDMTNERIGNSTDMFTGSFNGNEKYLYAGFMIIANTTNTSAKGLFNYLGPNGKLINVKITGLDITDANPGSKVGGLVGETANGSYIAYSSIRSGKISADTDVGAFVGIHNGVMEFSGGGLEVRGKTRVGGLIGTIGPTGVLRDSISHSRVSPNQDAYSTFGGVVGNNGGLIKRVQSRAEQYLVEKIPTTGAIVGGIAGQNTGTIEDISTEQDKIELNFVNGTTSYIVDPIVATNTGTIRRVISTTEVKLPQDYIGSCSTPATNCSGVGCHSQQTCSIDGGAWFPQTDLTIYTGIDMAPGGTVIDSYHAIDPHMAFHGTSVSGCTGTGTITVSMSTASPPSFTGTGDIYVEINNWEKVYPVNSITGTETQLLITASDCTDFPGGANIQLVKFVTGSTPSSTDMATLGNIETYCSSAVGAADNPYFTCSNSGDWDIVTDIDHTRDLGKQRLLNKYMSMMNGTINFNEGPFWSIEQGKPPRLISFD